MTAQLAASAGAQPGRDRPTPVRSWYALAVFFAAAILSYTDRQILNLVVDPVRADLGIDDFQISLLQGAAFAFIYAIVGLPLGRWADTHNRRNLILAGVLIWSTATAACGLATSFAEIFIARMFVGIGEAALAPAAISLIHDLFPERRRGTAMGIFISGMVAGIGAANVTGGALLSLFSTPGATDVYAVGLEPWRAVMITVGLPGILVALLLIGVPEPRRRDSGLAAASRLPRRSLRESLADLGPGRRTLSYLILGIALATTVEYAIGAWLPTLLIRVHGMTPGEVGAWLGSIVIIAGGLGTLLGGLFSDALRRTGRKNARILLPVIALLLALPTMSLPLLGDPSAVIAMFAVYTFLTAMATTSGITAVQSVVSDRLRGLATSVIAFANTALGLGLGPSLVGFSAAYLFAGSAAVAQSISMVAVPLLCAAILFLLLSLRAPCAELTHDGRSGQ
jgi:MFS family permease